MNQPPHLDEPNALPALWGEGSQAARSKLRRPLTLIAGLCLIIVLLAALVPVGGAVIASGQVGVASRIKRIAHPTGGVIAEIPVFNGQKVIKGQLLMRFDDRVSAADAIYSGLTVQQLLAQRARLEAERLAGGSIRFPTELLASADPNARKAMEDEQRLFDIRRSEEGQLHAQFASRITQFNQQIAGYRAQIGSMRHQIALIAPERRNVRELWDKQLVTISRLNQLERTAADLEGGVASLEAEIAGTRARISEAQEQSIQLRESRRAQAGTELGQVNTALNQQMSRSVAARDQQDRSEIRAPYSGTVEKIAFAAIGDVVKPAEPIMEIVPDADQMVIEARIAPDDIDQVRSGQGASIRFAAFNRSSTPEIDGTVIYVANDRTENPQTQQAFFVARMAIDPAKLRAEGLDLRSGMPAEVYIRTGRRSILSYIFKPLRDQLARAFRDN